MRLFKIYDREQPLCCFANQHKAHLFHAYGRTSLSVHGRFVNRPYRNCDSPFGSREIQPRSGGRGRSRLPARSVLLHTSVCRGLHRRPAPRPYGFVFCRWIVQILQNDTKVFSADLSVPQSARCIFKLRAKGVQIRIKKRRELSPALQSYLYFNSSVSTFYSRTQ